MRDLKYYPEGFYTFEDKYRGIKRLNVYGHSGYYENGFMLCLDVNGHNIGKTPQGLFEILYPLKLKRFRYLRLLLCNSASGDENSFACHFSKLCPHTYVEGYIGNVRTRRIVYDPAGKQFNTDTDPHNPRVMNSLFQIGFVRKVHSFGYPQEFTDRFRHSVNTLRRNIDTYEPLDPDTPHESVWYYGGTKITDNSQIP
ncbi:hypothetical protein [Xenorhabdus hominickii]|uniref:Uncharacterized protein n=1 Tax=Xenorhabdus hominickii TaxID=351679 RepID=A0A2G0QDV3_XENHO|nr:hypothetical protein [Xenorhabdus hominickii]AOM41469.1 hypothetical protein A9255_13330 [Xenorhabdus hominickii]PHM57400.1 hypothetical protein Xhom_00367 [Xenorhabdus hominickii]